jgi:hypothetical protein
MYTLSKFRIKSFITTHFGEIMEVKIENGRLLINIELQTPTPSASGKTLVVASTRGNVKTDCIIDGKPVVIGLNAYIKK